MSTSVFPNNDSAVTEDTDTARHPSGGPHQLRVLSGMHEGASTELCENSWLVLGSGGQCDIVLRDDSIVEQHCLIGYQAGEVTVRVLDGIVRLHGRAVEPRETVSLTDYEALQVGMVGIAFGSPGSARWTEVSEQWDRNILTEETGSSDTADVGDNGFEPEATQLASDPLGLSPRSGRRGRLRRLMLGRHARLAFRSLAVSVLVLGGVAGSWHGVSQATNTIQSKAGVMKTINQMGFTELVLSKGSGGLDLLTGVVPTEADRADLVNVLAKAGLRPASDIVTGEHLAMAVQNEFRQRGWNVMTSYVTGGTVLVDGLAPDPEVKALESRILGSIKGVKQLAFVKDNAGPATGGAATGANLAAANTVKSKSGIDPKADGKRITGVVSGEEGYLVTADGSRYSRGAVMQDGTEIERIADGSVTFIRKGKSLTVDF
jgi:type III secretion system YscD/HrpQ family protein